MKCCPYCGLRVRSLRLGCHVCLVAWTIALSGCVSPKLTGNPSTMEVTQKTLAFRVGETTVRAEERQFERGSLTMVNLHEDENASVEAGAAVLQKTGGKLIALRHGGTRRVEF